MAKKKINLQVNYIPLYKFKLYKNLKKFNYHGAERYYKNAVSLPIYFSIKENDILRVCDNLKKLIVKFKNE